MTTNPQEVVDIHGIFNGVIAIGGGQQAHKMSGLAGSLELLTRLALAPLQKDTDAYSFFMTINPSYFGNGNVYKNMVSQLEEEIVKGKKQEGIKRIFFSGQKSYLLRQKNHIKKTVAISDSTYKFLFSNNESTVKS